jgi:hypothetical protein
MFTFDPLGAVSVISVNIMLPLNPYSSALSPSWIAKEVETHTFSPVYVQVCVGKILRIPPADTAGCRRVYNIVTHRIRSNGADRPEATHFDFSIKIVRI